MNDTTSEISVEKRIENEHVLAAKRDKDAKNAFLSDEQLHILHLAARILGKTLSVSDDEYSVSLIAVSEAIDSYDPDRGSFWNYASLVIGSRLKDHFRSATRLEIPTGPDVFGSDMNEEDPTGLQIEIRDKTAVVIDTRLRDELDALSAELEEFDIDLFDLPEYAPHTIKTRRLCAKLIEAFFIPPPPLTDEMKRTRNLPASKLMERTGSSRKFIDKHRKYLVAASLIKAGDYPGMAEYLPVSGMKD